MLLPPYKTKILGITDEKTPPNPPMNTPLEQANEEQFAPVRNHM